MNNLVNTIKPSNPTRLNLSNQSWQSLNSTQKVAILKSGFFLMIADGIYTEEEKMYYAGLCKMTNSTDYNKLMNEIETMKASDMFTIISSMNKSQKTTVLFHWVQLLYASQGNEMGYMDYMRINGLFNLDNYPKEKPWFVDMARRCNIDISPFLNGTVKIY